MNDQEKIIKRISNFARAEGFTKSGLAVASGLHINTLRYLHTPDFNPMASTITEVLKFIEKYEGKNHGRKTSRRP